jgi:hypothetical protein
VKGIFLVVHRQAAREFWAGKLYHRGLDQMAASGKPSPQIIVTLDRLAD